ncbi:MAG: hypothetical protein Ct9H90mP26_2650 [Methanobacteriota archaeon]|nr:MAG: hypothetical protein Ct9H90mP26_2650 [Euryarchaeota archaeon]
MISDHRVRGDHPLGWKGVEDHYWKFKANAENFANLAVQNEERVRRIPMLISMTVCLQVFGERGQGWMTTMRSHCSRVLAVMPGIV